MSATFTIYRFRNFLAASRKRNIHRFGLLGRRRSLDFIDNNPGVEETVVLTGEKDGENTIFTAPLPGFSHLVSNGLRLSEGTDYTAVVTGNVVTITMNWALQSSDSLFGVVVDPDWAGTLIPGVVAPMARWDFAGQLKDGENTEFTLPDGMAFVQIYRNGLQLKEGLGYELSGENLSFAVAPEADDEIWAIVSYS